jgi:hypothetical protein
MAQGWNKTYGIVGYGASIQKTTDGGYIVAGSSSNQGFLFKLNAQGDSLWLKEYGGPDYDRLKCVQQTSDGGYIMAGTRDGNSINYAQCDLYLIKTDGNGNETWSKSYGALYTRDYGQSVKQTTDGGYIVTGKTTLIGNGDIYLLKTDAQGDELWSKTFGGLLSGHGYSVQQTADGGYVVSGNLDTDNIGSSNAYLLKVDGNGVEQWSKSFGDSLVNQANSVQQTTDGGYVFSGLYTYGVFNISSTQNADVYVVKTDGNGVEQWLQTYGGAEYDLSESIKQTPDGGYIVAGRTKSFGGNRWDFYLIKLNSTGTQQWYKTFDKGEYDYCHSVELTTDGGYIMCGMTFGHLWIVKTDGNGNATSTTTIPLSTEKGEVKMITNYLGQETKPTKNTPLLYQYENGTVEKKIIIE